MKFLNVSCSQCGQEFGPGDHGFSMCRDHRTKLENLKVSFERTGALDDFDLDVMNVVDARFLREAHDLMPQLLAAVAHLEGILMWAEQKGVVLGCEDNHQQAIEALENLK